MSRGSKKGEHRGGREKGTPNKKTQSLFDKCDELGIDPFMELLKIAKDTTHERQFDAVKEVSKYLYPTRKAVELSGSIDPQMQEAADDINKLTKEQQVELLEQRLKDLKDGS